MGTGASSNRLKWNKWLLWQVHIPTLNTASENSQDDKHVQNGMPRPITARLCQYRCNHRQQRPANHGTDHHHLGTTTITQVTTNHLCRGIAPEECRQNNALNMHTSHTHALIATTNIIIYATDFIIYPATCPADFTAMTLLVGNSQASPLKISLKIWKVITEKTIWIHSNQLLAVKKYATQSQAECMLWTD